MKPAFKFPTQTTILLLSFFCIMYLIDNVESVEISKAVGGENDDPRNGLLQAVTGFLNPRKRCPLCDSSVYSYCTDKLLHDACCCNDPYGMTNENSLPYQCRFADCSFLHANSCKEHRLITACCCNNLYLRKN